MKWKWWEKSKPEVPPTTDELFDLTVDMLIKLSIHRHDFFDICPVDRVARAMGIDDQNQAYTILLMLHCVRYKEMDRRLRRNLPSLIREALDMPLSKEAQKELAAMLQERTQ